MQRAAIVNGEFHEAKDKPALLPKLGGDADKVNFYEFLISSTSTFQFRDEADLLTYVDRFSGYYAKQPVNFTSSASGAHLERPQVTQRPVLNETASEVQAKIEVTLDTTPIEVNVFASSRRHDPATLRADMQKPPEAKNINTYALNPQKFRTKFQDYALEQGMALNRRLMFHGFNPKTVRHDDPEMKFETDIEELPNSSYGRANAIHAFPSSGSLVRRITPETYKHLVAVASYMYGTDLHKAARRADTKNKTEHRRELVEGWERKKGKPGSDVYLVAAQKAKKELRDHIQKMEDAGFKHGGDAPAAIATLLTKTPREIGPVVYAANKAVGGLFALLSTYGGVAEIEPTADVSVGESEGFASYQAILLDPAGKEVYDALVGLTPPTHPIPTTPPVASPDRATKLKAAQVAFAQPYVEQLKIAKGPDQNRLILEKRFEQLNELLTAAVQAGFDLNDDKTV